MVACTGYAGTGVQSSNLIESRTKTDSQKDNVTIERNWPEPNGVLVRDARTPELSCEGPRKAGTQSKSGVTRVQAGNYPAPIRRKLKMNWCGNELCEDD